MSKLHEVLAVEGELAGVFKNILDETKTTFDKKPNLFQGLDKSYDPFDAAKAQEATSEHVEITESVPSKLAYMFGHVIKFIDCNLQKESANQHAVADLVVTDDYGNETILATRLPATFLLGLETKLKVIRDVLQAIPTLPPGFTWSFDAQQALPGVWRRNEPEVRFKTEKAVKHQVLVPATDKFPAQIEKWNEDVPVGKIITIHCCGMMSPHDKSQLLARVDTLARAVKQARQRANSVEIDNVTVGKSMVDYILG